MVKVIVVVPLFASVMVGLLMVSVLVSLLVIVPVPTAPEVMLAAATGAIGVTTPRVIVKVSSPSMTASPLTLIVMVLVSFAVPENVSGLLVMTV